MPFKTSYLDAEDNVSVYGVRDRIAWILPDVSPRAIGDSAVCPGGKGDPGAAVEI